MSHQLDLFGAGARPPAARAGIGAAHVAQALVALARALPPQLFLGTSSWAFPGWAGIVYDRVAPEAELAREGLRAYAAHPILRCVGIDRTFYAPVSASGFARYAAQVPESFRFLVKGPALVTDPFMRGARGKPAGDNPRFLDAAFAGAHFVAPCLEGLGAKAGPLVFQFPPLGRGWLSEPARFIGRLHGFLDALPRGPLYAIELRDPRVLGAELAAALAATSARYCFGVHARMPDVASQAAAMRSCAPGPLVARWNLHGGLRYEQAKAHYAPFDRLVDEDPGTRAALRELCAAALATGEAAFVVANNKAEGSAPLTLIKLAEAVTAAAGESRP